MRVRKANQGPETELQRKRKDLRGWIYIACFYMCLFMFILLLLGVTLLDYFDIVTGLFDVPEKTTSDVALFIILAIMALGAFVLDCIRVRKLRHEIDELEQENRTGSDKKSL